MEIDCQDCHGTSQTYPNLFTSGPAALAGGLDMGALRTPDGRRRFEWVGDDLYQRSMLYPEKEWKMSLVKDSVNPNHGGYNPKAARAKLMSKDTNTQGWGLDVASADLAHSYEEMECYAVTPPGPRAAEVVTFPLRPTGRLSVTIMRVGWSQLRHIQSAGSPRSTVHLGGVVRPKAARSFGTFHVCACVELNQCEP